MSFPLQRLPFLAFAEVVKSMEFYEKIRLILLSLRIRRYISSCFKPSPTITIKANEEYAVESLKISKAHWLTASNLCDLVNCPTVRLHRATFTNHDLNFFFKFVWKNDVKIKEWYIYNDRKLQLAVIMNGIDNLRTIRRTILRTSNGIAYEIIKYDGMLHIRRAN